MINVLNISSEAASQRKLLGVIDDTSTLVEAMAPGVN